MIRVDYEIEQGDVLKRGMARVEIVRIAGNMASVRLLKDRFGLAPARETIESVRMRELAGEWELIA